MSAKNQHKHSDFTSKCHSNSRFGKNSAWCPNCIYISTINLSSILSGLRHQVVLFAKHFKKAKSGAASSIYFKPGGGGSLCAKVAMANSRDTAESEKNIISCFHTHIRTQLNRLNYKHCLWNPILQKLAGSVRDCLIDSCKNLNKFAKLRHCSIE